MKLKYKTRRTLTQILSIVLLCAVGFGAIMGISALSKKLNEETTVIHPSFEVGGLGADGKYVDTDESIYTKDSFECLGLEVKLDFDSNVTYQAFYYDELDKFISATPVYEESLQLSVPENATYARLVVTPIWADDVEDEDRVCHWYDVFKYANQLEITVFKDQGDEDAEENVTCEHNYVIGKCSECGHQLTNLFSVDKWTSSDYYSNGSLISSGDTDPYALANIEENIMVKPGDVVQSNILFYNTSYNNASCIRVAGFDADGNWVKDVLTPSSTVTEAGFVVPDGIYQLNIPIWADQLDSGDEIYIYVWEK